MKSEFEENTRIGQQMMFWRKVTLVLAVPFGLCLLGSFVGGQINEFVPYTGLSLIVAFVAQPMMLMNQFRLVDKMHGQVSASLHIGLTVILTPFFLIGPVLIPLLVLGDAQRLLLEEQPAKK